MPNPTLKSLDIFVGEWSVEVSNLSFGSDPSAIVSGRTHFEWLEGGAFLSMSSLVEHADFPNAISVIGRDEAVSTYIMMYSDSRGVSRLYEMSFEGGVWKLWRDDPEFPQRFTGTFSDNGNTITARWESTSDGSNWERDFDMTYTRISYST